jgi:hypothetical protein
MKYYEAFSEQSEYLPQPNETSIFLGGGISNCADWQSELSNLLKDTNLVILNPRRNNYPEFDPKATEEQIKWEHRHLNRATAIVFWFAQETLCPITLFEYGKWLMSSKPLFVGCHPNYKRRIDVEIQTKLEKPWQKIFSNIEEISADIINRKDYRCEI